MILVGVVLIVIALLCSSESFRRGVYADDKEIMRRAGDGDTGCGLLFAMVLFALLGLAVLAMAGAL